MKRSFDEVLADLPRSFDDVLADLGRLIEETDSEHSREELHHARQFCETRLSARYTAHASPIVAAILAEVGDTVFLQNVLEPLARSECVRFVLSLARVNKQWRLLVQRITHLNLGQAIVGTYMYPQALQRLPALTSLRSHYRILAHYHSNLSGLDRVRELTVTGPHETDAKYSYHAKHLTSLTSLVFPDCDCRVIGLGGLTALRQLDIRAEAFSGAMDTLLALTQLHTLRLRAFPDHLDLTPLVNLRELDSDCVSHFARYTGYGFLSFDGGELVFDTEQEARDALHPQCWNAYFDGNWVKGVFSGRGDYQYGDDEYNSFEGTFVDGKRDGYGEDVREIETLMYKGHWRAGLQHGHFDVYSWTGHCNRLYTLARTEEWQHGQLLSVAECEAL
jgi:hypothetical protein